MCLGVPMLVIDTDGKNAVAEIDGIRREASLMMLDEPVKAGDYIIVHAGFAISRINPEEAEETLLMMREIFSPEDMA